MIHSRQWRGWPIDCHVIHCQPSTSGWRNASVNARQHMKLWWGLDELPHVYLRNVTCFQPVSSSSLQHRHHNLVSTPTCELADAVPEVRDLKPCLTGPQPTQPQLLQQRHLLQQLLPEDARSLGRLSILIEAQLQ